MMGALNAVNGDFACKSHYLDTQVGVYTVSVGASSQDIKLNGKLVNPSLSVVSVSDSEPVPKFESGD